MSIVRELKRRNVFRVAALYLVSGWVLLQITDVLAGVLGLPEWTLRLVAFLLLLGFPLALIFSWVFELTPEGIRREVQVDPTESITSTTGQKLKVATGMLVVVALGLFVLNQLVLHQTSDVAEDRVAESQGAPPVPGAVPDDDGRSIAVLPFVNMSADPDNVYFSDGLSEELLNFLSKVDGLRVAARTSSFQFRNAEGDIGDIGQQLKVNTVLEGSVRKAGNRARITAQLIEVESGYHLWSETYDRDLDSVFEVQEEIARAIVDALQLPLLGRGATTLAVASTSNAEAYDLYLLGRHHARETTADAFEKAIDYYQEAIRADPDFALAYSGLADAYVYLADYGDIATSDALKLAEDAAGKGMELDPAAAEPLASMGLILGRRSRHSEAISYFDEALAINPNYVSALLWKGDSLQDQGRYQDGLAMAEQAYQLDPLSGFTRSRLVLAFSQTGQDERALKFAREMIAADPDDPFPYEELGNFWLARGDLDKAVPQYAAAHRLRPDDTYMAWRLVQTHIRLDDLDSAAQWVDEARQRGPEASYTLRAQAELLRASGDLAAYRAFAEQWADMKPDSESLRVFAGDARFMTGDLEGAEAEFREALRLSGYDPAGSGLELPQWYPAAQLAAVLRARGETSESDRLLGQLDQLREGLGQGPVALLRRETISAYVAAVREQAAEMVDALRRAGDHGFRGHLVLVRNPIAAPYLDDPAFKELIEQMRVQEAAMRRRLVESEAGGAERT